MPQVRFFIDFQGVETHDVFYGSGVHNVPDDVASRVVKDGRAEFVKPDALLDVEPQFENAHYGAQPEPEPKNDDAIYDVMTAPKKKGGKK